MDPGEGFSGGMFRWDPRAAAPAGSVQPYIPSSISHMAAPEATQPALSAGEAARAAVRELEDVFVGYGVRYATVARMGDLGFTASTLAGMREEEVDDMMATLSHLFRWDLLVGERYGIKAAIRAERRRIDSLVFPPPPQPQQQPTGGLHLAHNQHHAETIHFDDPRSTRSRLLLLSPDHHTALDALSQEGRLSEEAVQLEREAAGSGGEAGGEYQGRGKNAQQRSKKRGDKKRKKKKKGVMDVEEDEEVRIGEEEEEEDDAAESESERGGAGAGGERQREHPFIVTEPGEVARAKKNGLDYLFHLYQQCHQFLLQVQAVAKDRGDKCPTKVTNLVFRYAKRVGASYINKPKMRHYVHCYALHVLDEEGSNALRRAFKERGENVGAWRLACYKPLVAISAAHDFDVDAVFNAHPRLSIWYVPTKLRQLCHLARAAASSSSNSSPVVTDAADVVHLFAAAPLRRSPHDRSPAFPWAAST